MYRFRVYFITDHEFYITVEAPTFTEATISAQHIAFARYGGYAEWTRTEEED